MNKTQVRIVETAAAGADDMMVIRLVECLTGDVLVEQIVSKVDRPFWIQCCWDIARSRSYEVV